MFQKRFFSFHIPARLLSSLDFKRYVVSKNSYDYLSQCCIIPVLPLSQLNSSLIKSSEGNILKFGSLLKKLSKINSYILKCPSRKKLENALGKRQYFLSSYESDYSSFSIFFNSNGRKKKKSNICYGLISIQDMVELLSGQNLILTLEKAVSYYADHIRVKCKTCKRNASFDVEFLASL